MPHRFLLPKNLNTEFTTFNSYLKDYKYSTLIYLRSTHVSKDFLKSSGNKIQSIAKSASFNTSFKVSSVDPGVKDKCIVPPVSTDGLVMITNTLICYEATGHKTN